MSEKTLMDGKPGLRNTVTRFGVGIAFVLCLALHASYSWWHQDDLYIHLRYAEQLHATGIWTFNGDAPSYGTTSPIWVLLLSLAGSAEYFWSAKLLSLAATVAAFWTMFSMRRKFKKQWWFFTVLVAFGVNHWLRLATGSGMEATLAGWVMLMLVIKSFDLGKMNMWSGCVLGMLAGLAGLVRPELLYVPPLLLLGLVIATRSLRHGIGFLFGVAFVLAPWVIYADATFHQILPTTVYVKQGAISLSATSILSSIQTVLVFFLSSNGIEIVAVILAAAYTLWFDSFKRVRGRWIIPVALVLGLMMIYVMNQAKGGERISYRYATPILPALILLGGLAMDRLTTLSVVKPRFDRLIRLTVPLLIIGANVGLDVLHVPFLIKSHAYVENICVKYGSYLRSNAPSNARVACYDVGAIGYYSKIHVLDLFALVSPETFHVRVNAQSINDVRPVYLFKPEYYVVPWLGHAPQILSSLPPYDLIYRDTVRSYRLSFSPDTAGYETALLRLHWIQDAGEGKRSPDQGKATTLSR